jgi:hypothetical protein
MTNTFYIVLVKGCRYWKSPQIKRFTKRTPQLRDGEVAVKVEAEISDMVFDPPKVPLIVGQNNIIYPKVHLNQA